MINWREYIDSLYNCAGDEMSVQLHPPAADMDISRVESALGLALPSSLKDLLTSTDGVMQMMKLDKEIIPIGWLIWPLQEIARRNLFYRSEQGESLFERRFDELLFFADAGADGILFAYKVLGTQAVAPDVFVWVPISDTVRQVAPSLEVFLDPSHGITV